MSEETQVVSARRDVAAAPEVIFELIADPARQPDWDGNGNLIAAAPDQRVTGVGDVFVVRVHSGSDRENHVVEFTEGRSIAWRPADVGAAPAGHLWRWTLEPLDDGGTRVTHTYDWTQLTDENRFARARDTSAAMLAASIDRLAELAERSG